MTEESVEENKGEKMLIWSAVLLIATVFAIVIFIRISQRPTVKTIDEIMRDTLTGKETANNFVYNGYAFAKIDNMWWTRWKSGNKAYNIPLRFNPRQVENVTIDGELDKRFTANNLYITFNPDEERFTYLALAAGELSLNLVTALNATPIAACITNSTDTCSTRPIVSCQNEDKAVIYIREANETAVLLNGNCMVVQGNGMEIMRAVDRVLFIWYGIMPRNTGS